MIEYCGEGYCFHSTLLPVGVALEQATTNTFLYVDAKPRGSKKARLLDAKHTLSSLPSPGDEFTRVNPPVSERQTARSGRNGGSGDRHGNDDDDDWNDFP